MRQDVSAVKRYVVKFLIVNPQRLEFYVRAENVQIPTTFERLFSILYIQAYFLLSVD